MTLRSTTLTVALSAAVIIAGCSRTLRNVAVLPGPKPGVGALWQAPPDPQRRDLRHGPGGPALTPNDGTFALVAVDDTGWSPGFDVKDAAGIEWSVKIGPEAQSEIAASRILWAAGFHQPPTYYVAQWSLSGAQTGPQKPGRFRPSLPSEEVIGEWSWHENPFIGTREFGGLIVINLMITNWDWKATNNKIYRSLDEPGTTPRYVVRDVGAAFGRFTYPSILKPFRLRGFGQGTRNNLADFEQQGFIKQVHADGRVEFHYKGIYRDVIASVTTADVIWATERLAVLTDDQWRDAFGAAGYTAEETSRFVSKLKSKIADGLALARQ
jgi:hypothetical protein